MTRTPIRPQPQSIRIMKEEGSQPTSERLVTTIVARTHPVSSIERHRNDRAVLCDQVAR